MTAARKPLVPWSELRARWNSPPGKSGAWLRILRAFRDAGSCGSQVWSGSRARGQIKPREIDWTGFPDARVDDFERELEERSEELTGHLHLRCSSADRARWRSAAEGIGIGLSEWVRATLDRAAVTR